MKLRPMLAAPAPSFDQLIYPLYASPKIDGIRCLIVSKQWYSDFIGAPPAANVDAVAVSRTLKPIPNRYLQSCLDDARLIGLDGELIVGLPTAPDTMSASMSGLMSFDGKPAFTYHWFDAWTRQIPYGEWLDSLPGDRVPVHPHMVQLHQKIIYTPDQLGDYENYLVAHGFEGVITRHPLSPYKFNRSTAKQQYLLKIKRYQSAEAVVIGTEPLMHNSNALDYDERGYAKHSSHKDGKIEMDMLGALLCRLPDGRIFHVGTGFNGTQRINLWKVRHTLLNKTITFKYFPHGEKDAPRHPVFVSFRHEVDL